MSESRPGRDAGERAAPHAALSECAALLHQAAARAWEISDRSGLGSEFLSIGLDAYAASGHAINLADATDGHGAAGVSVVTDEDVEVLVGRAGRCLLSLDSDAVPGLPGLVVEIGELARAIRDVDR